MSGSSEEMEDKGSKPQEKGLIWDSWRNSYARDHRKGNWKYTRAGKGRGVRKLGS